jgi:hypothetical protein
MKKLFLCCSLIFLIHSNSPAQQKNQSIIQAGNSFISLRNKNDVNIISAKNYLKINYGPEKDQEFYQHRSKNYRIVGWSTLGAGVLLAGIGIIAASGDYATSNANSNTAGVLTVAGAVSGVVSIRFMIMASVYKHKARALVETQKTGFAVPSNLSSYITGINVAIPLGN